MSKYECVCFHETNLPFGRGGSSIQNLIFNGYKETVITAFRMTKNLDDGPIYLKRKLCLEGLTEEIYMRISNIVAGMIEYIVVREPKPQQQKGEVVVFKRRKLAESNMINATKKIDNLEKLFDFIRKLDADTYPKAYLEINGF